MGQVVYVKLDLHNLDLETTFRSHVAVDCPSLDLLRSAWPSAMVLAVNWHPDVRDPCKSSGLNGGGGDLQLHNRTRTSCTSGTK